MSYGVTRQLIYFFVFLDHTANRTDFKLWVIVCVVCHAGEHTLQQKHGVALKRMSVDIYSLYVVFFLAL